MVKNFSNINVRKCTRTYTTKWQINSTSIYKCYILTLWTYSTITLFGFLLLSSSVLKPKKIYDNIIFPKLMIYFLKQKTFLQDFEDFLGNVELLNESIIMFKI